MLHIDKRKIPGIQNKSQRAGGRQSKRGTQRNQQERAPLAECVWKLCFNLQEVLSAAMWKELPHQCYRVCWRRNCGTAYNQPHSSTDFFLRAMQVHVWVVSTSFLQLFTVKCQKHHLKGFLAELKHKPTSYFLWALIIIPFSLLEVLFFLMCKMLIMLILISHK